MTPWGVGSAEGEREALTRPHAGHSGGDFAKFRKVVRVKHASEVPATRVVVMPGEGSAWAGCRKMDRIVGTIRSEGLAKESLS